MKSCNLALSALLVATCVVPAVGQTHKPVTNGIPDAPVPAPMIYGKRAFISYQFAETDLTNFSGEPQRDYNEFYAAMKNWGRYELVTDPKNADLVYTIHLNPALESLNVSVTSPSGISLWGFRVKFLTPGNQKKDDKVYSDAIAQLMGYIKLLVEQNTPAKTP